MAAASSKLPKQPLPAPLSEPRPLIEYIGKGAENIKFEINPKAERYVVHANGMVKEYL